MEKCACKGSFLDKLLQPAILALLCRQKMHGFSLLKKMEENGVVNTGGVDPTGLYRTLKKMEYAGLLTSEWDVSEGAQPRRIYAITEDGIDCLSHWGDTLVDYRSSIDRLIGTIAEALKEASEQEGK